MQIRQMQGDEPTWQMLGGSKSSSQMRNPPSRPVKMLIPCFFPTEASPQTAYISICLRSAAICVSLSPGSSTAVRTPPPRSL